MTPLHPQARALLDNWVAAWPEIDWQTIQAAELRTMLGGGESPFAPGDEVAEIRDIHVPGEGGPLRLRFYRPVDCATPAPLTLYFHGGGFVCGPVEGHDNVCRCLANRARAIVVSVDYRLAPEAPFPAANRDALCALEWLRDNAPQIGGDAQRLAVAGDSAGANIAAVLCHQARDRGTPPIRHQLLFYPVTDCRFDTDSYRRLGEGYLLSRDMMRWYWRQYLPHESQAADPAASPLRQPNLRGLPAATVVTAGFDPLHDEGQAFAQALEAAGVDVTHVDWPDQIHGFVSMQGAIDAAQDALNFGAEALLAAFSAHSPRIG